MVVVTPYSLSSTRKKVNPLRLPDGQHSIQETMSLKLATLDDLPYFEKFAKAFYLSSSFSPQLKYNPAKVRQWLELAVSSQHRDCLVLLNVQNELPVGMLVATISQTPFSDDLVASELAWWVDEEYRGTKGSLELVFAYEEWAKRVGAKHVTMALLPALTNPKVEGYYEKLGYHKTEISYIKAL